MNNIFLRNLAVIISALIAGCKQETRHADIAFDKKVANFDINRGEEVTTSFVFENTGSDTLLIKLVNASCGCTKVQYPKEPIAPGLYGVIKVTYDNAEDGNQTQNVVKTVLVKANTVPIYNVLLVKGVVH